MASVLKFGKRVAKTDDNQNGWEEIYTFHRGPKSDETLVGHKSVICFPGDGVIYDEEMNGCCKNIECMLQKAGILEQNMPHLYSLGFDTNTADHRRKVLDKEELTRYGLPKSEDSKEYWKPFFDIYILPLVQTQDGKARSIHETIQNFQNITFVSHCHGSIFAHQIEEMLVEKVRLFYPGREKEVLSNLRMLHLASRKPVGKETGIKHLNVVSLADDMYADYGMLAEDNLYKILHKQNMESRTAILPISEKEAITVFREMATPKTYGEDRNDHRQMMQLVAGRGKDSDNDTEAQENEEGLSFVRGVLKYFVEHPEDTGTIKDIMRKVNHQFTAININEGQRLSSEIKKENHENKSLLDFLGEHSLGKVSGDPHFYLQRMSDGQYFYEHVKENAQKSGDFRSFKSVLKKVCGLISDDLKIKEVHEAIQRKDWQIVDLLTARMMPKDIGKYVLSDAKADDLPYLYKQIKEAKLSSTGQWELLDSLLVRSGKIQNSTGRIRVQSVLKQEKSKQIVQVNNNNQRY